MQRIILCFGNVADVLNVAAVLKGSPDNPQFSFKKIADGKIIPVPLPDSAPQ